jgi:hypothetical protein
MAGLGEELVRLHLLKSKSLVHPGVKYFGAGDDIIEKPRYDESSKSVFINQDKYFQGIEPEVWKYHIGGYQVLEKYLKDRKNRQMTDPETYCKIAKAIGETIALQARIDLLYEECEC